jgi:hypothetical protein
MQWIQRLFTKKKPVENQSVSTVIVPAARAQIMAKMLVNTYEEELPCDQVCDVMDQFADMVQRGEDAAEFLPLVKHHLDLCPDCREEYEALLRILEGTQ